MLILAWIAAVGIPLGLIVWLVVTCVNDEIFCEMILEMVMLVAVVGGLCLCVASWFYIADRYATPVPAIVQPEAPR